jgi:hypothetical protein
MVRVNHTEDVTVQDIGEMLRAMPGVLTIGQVSHNGDNNTAVLKVKLLTTKPASEAFASFKSTSVQRIPEVKKIEIADKTIEKKK